MAGMNWSGHLAAWIHAAAGIGGGATAGRACPVGGIMTKEEFAARINGREMGSEVTEAEAGEAKASGLIIVYGYSDDCAEVEGFFREEVNLCDGETFRVDQEGIIPAERDDSWSDEEMLDYLIRKGSADAVTITSEWCPNDEETLWRFSASVPCASFVIKEEDAQFCRGIVFDAPSGRAR